MESNVSPHSAFTSSHDSGFETDFVSRIAAEGAKDNNACFLEGKVTKAAFGHPKILKKIAVTDKKTNVSKDD